MLASLIMVGSVLAAGGTAFFMLQLTGSLIDDSRGIVGEASAPNSGRLVIGDAFLQIDEDGDAMLNEYVTLGPGARPFNLSQTVMRLQVDNTTVTFPFGSDGADGKVAFTAHAARDADGSFADRQYLMDNRDLLQLQFDLAAAGISLSGDEIIQQSQLRPDDKPVAAYELEVPNNLPADSLRPLGVTQAS